MLLIRCLNCFEFIHLTELAKRHSCVGLSHLNKNLERKMKVQQSNVRDLSKITGWSARSQEAIINNGQNGARIDFFSNRIADLHAKKLEQMLKHPSPTPSMADPNPPLSRRNLALFEVVEKPSFFASFKAKLAKLFCLAKPN